MAPIRRKGELATRDGISESLVLGLHGTGIPNIGTDMFIPILLYLVLCRGRTLVNGICTLAEQTMAQGDIPHSLFSPLALPSSLFFPALFFALFSDA
jgi:hypothetical protein